MKVVCKTNSHTTCSCIQFNLTIGKVYEVMDIEKYGKWFWLIDDTGEWITVSSKYFYPIDVIRNKQLEEILK